MIIFPPGLIGANGRLSIDYFLDADTGMLRDEIAALVERTRLDVPFCVLPHQIVIQYQNTKDIVRRWFQYDEWLGDNTRLPWMPWVANGVHSYHFASDIDAVAFKLYIQA